MATKFLALVAGSLLLSSSVSAGPPIFSPRPPPVRYKPPPVRYEPPPVRYEPPPVRYEPPPVRYEPPPVHYEPPAKPHYYAPRPDRDRIPIKDLGLTDGLFEKKIETPKGKPITAAPKSENREDDTQQIDAGHARRILELAQITRDDVRVLLLVNDRTTVNAAQAQIQQNLLLGGSGDWKIGEILAQKPGGFLVIIGHVEQTPRPGFVTRDASGEELYQLSLDDLEVAARQNSTIVLALGCRVGSCESSGLSGPREHR